MAAEFAAAEQRKAAEQKRKADAEASANETFKGLLMKHSQDFHQYENMITQEWNALQGAFRVAKAAEEQGILMWMLEKAEEQKREQFFREHPGSEAAITRCANASKTAIHTVFSAYKAAYDKPQNERAHIRVPRQAASTATKLKQYTNEDLNRIFEGKGKAQTITGGSLRTLVQIKRALSKLLSI